MEYVKLPKTKRGELTLKKICDAAEELFAQNGFYTTEISDITRKAGVATGTFYTYFADKNSVFLHLMDDLGHKLRQEIKQAKLEESPKSFIELERISARVYLSFVQRHWGIFHIVWQSMFMDVEIFKLYFERFSHGYIKEIKQAQESGEIRDIDPTLFSFILMGMHQFVALKHYVFDETEPDDAVIDQLVEFVARGLRKSPHKPGYLRTKKSA